MMKGPGMANSGNGLEKHAQTAIQVILVAITIWVGSSIISLRDSSIRSEEKYTQMRESIVELKSEIAALRTTIANGAERDLALSQAIRELTARVESLERRVIREKPEGRGRSND